MNRSGKLCMPNILQHMKVNLEGKALVPDQALYIFYELYLTNYVTEKFGKYLMP